MVRRTCLTVADGSSPHPRQHAVVDEPGAHPGHMDVRVPEPVAPGRHLPHRDVGEPTEPRPAVAVLGLRDPLVESAPRVGKSSTVGREVAGMPDGQRGQPDAEVARIVAAGRAVPRQRETVDDAAAHAVGATPAARRTDPPLPTGTRHRRDSAAIAPHIHDDRAALAQADAQPAPERRGTVRRVRVARFRGRLSRALRPVISRVFKQGYASLLAEVRQFLLRTLRVRAR